MSVDTIAHIARMSGGILYLMAVLLLVALAVAIERFWALSRMQDQCRIWVHELKSHTRVDARALQAQVRAQPEAPASQVVAMALSHSMDDSLEHFSNLLEEAVMDQAPRVDRGLWALDTIVTLAPLLGLLGTIIGMFNTFQALSNPGAATQAVTGGVGEALVATAAGLFIAVLGLVAFNGLNQRVRLVMHQLERIKVMLTNRMAPHYRPDGVRSMAPVQPASSAQRPTAVVATGAMGQVLQQKIA